MPALKDEKHERLAAGIARGLSVRAAAIEAGYTPRMAAARAWEIARRPAVVARAEELRPHYEPSAEVRIRQDTEALTPSAIRARLINELWDVMEDAKQARDRRSVIAASSEIAALTGLKTTRVELAASPLDGLTAAQLVALLNALDATGRGPAGLGGEEPLQIEGVVSEEESTAAA
jgi:hypothetical protein